MIASIRNETGAPIRRICRVLRLPRSSYYQASLPTPTKLQDQLLSAQIEKIFRRHSGRYGYRRIREDLVDLEFTCGPTRVRRLMKERGLRAIQPRSRAPRTSDGRADAPSQNLLLKRDEPTRPNEVWIGDITFIPASGQWHYLAVVIDLYSRRVLGWTLADHLRSDLVCQALDNALKSRADRHGLIFHSDRGSQYGSTRFREKLAEAGIAQSMSRRANPYDNAWTESFIGTLKREMLQDGCFEGDQDAKREIFAYIEGYYNTVRKHSSLGYLSPSKFESKTNEN